MTDNDIIKALELCIENDIFERNCDNCKYSDNHSNCMDNLFADVLKLINRQRTEIEHLRTCNETQKETIRTYHIGEIKREVAREIFKDIEQTIVNKYYTELYYFVNSRGGRCWGKTVKLTAFNIYNRLRESLSELKNQYTKAEKGGE